MNHRIQNQSENPRSLQRSHRFLPSQHLQEVVVYRQRVCGPAASAAGPVVHGSEQTGLYSAELVPGRGHGPFGGES